MSVKIVQGDLLTSTEQYLVHQCNCVTKRAAYLAKAIFTKYPWADIYRTRISPDRPGTIIIREQGEKYIIALLGQYLPGTPSKKDPAYKRIKYFQSGLLEIEKIQDLESIAFPYGIGCGAAGGDWVLYQEMIKQFSKRVTADVVIYKLQ